MRMLVTRPEPAASDTAKALAKLGLEPVIAPLLVLYLLSIGLAMIAYPAALRTDRRARR